MSRDWAKGMIDRRSLVPLTCKKCKGNVFEKITLDVLGYDPLAPEKGSVPMPIKMYKCFECKEDLEPQSRIEEIREERTRIVNPEENP